MDTFVGRTEEQARFRDMLRDLRGDGPSPELDESWVMVVRGPGGIGKSSLLGRLRAIAAGDLDEDAANRRRFVVADVDWETDQRRHSEQYQRFEGPPIWTILERIRTAIDTTLTDAGRPARGWRNRVAGIRRRRDRARSDRMFADFYQRVLQGPDLEAKARRLGVRPAPKGFSADDAAVLLKLAASGVTQVAGLPPVPAAVPAKAITNAVGGAASRIRRRARGGVDRLAYQALVDETGALVDAFARGLRELSRHRPIVLVLDTCELLGGAHEWLRLVMRASGRSVLWVVGMRLEDASDARRDSESYRYQHSLDERRLRTVSLGGFDDRTVERYLEHSNIRLGPAEMGRVAVSTRGVPLNVSVVRELLIRGVPVDDAVAPAGEISSMVRTQALRYLVHTRSIPELVPDLMKLYGLALRRGSDPHLLAVLWGVEPAAVGAEEERLGQRHDFVLSGRNVLHHDFRDTIQSFLLDAANRVAVEQMNRRAVAYLRGRLAESGAKTVDDQLADDRWCATAQALLWHTCWIDPAQGLAMLGHLFPAASLRPEWASTLLGTVAFFLPVATAGDQQALRALAELLQPVAGRAESAVLDRLFAAAYPEPVLAGEPSRARYVDLLRARYAARFELTVEQRARLLRRASTRLAAVSTPTSRAISAATADLVDEDTGLDKLSKTAKDGLLATIRLVIRCDDRDVSAWFALGRVLSSLRRYPDASQAYTKVTELRPDNLEAWYNLGDVFEQQYRYAEAEKQFRYAIGQGLVDADIFLRHAGVLSLLGRYDEADDLIETVMDLDPVPVELARAYSSRGRLLHQTDRFVAAESAYAESIRLNPASATTHAWRAETLAHLGRFVDAIASYQVAVGLDPNWSCDFGNLLGSAGRYDEAEVIMRKGLDLDPDEAIQHSNLGNILVALHRPEEAEAAYLRALERSPGSDPARPILLGNLAELRLTHGDRAAARTLLDEAVSIDERPVSVDLQLWMLLRTSEPAPARRHLMAARRRLDEGARTFGGYVLTGSRFCWAELRALADLGAGETDKAVEELAGAVPLRWPEDVFRSAQYDLLGEGEPVPGLDGLLNVWRRIIAADPAAAPWGGPVPLR